MHCTVIGWNREDGMSDCDDRRCSLVQKQLVWDSRGIDRFSGLRKLLLPLCRCEQLDDSVWRRKPVYVVMYVQCVTLLD